MTTNIIATIVVILSTNVTVVDNARRDPAPIFYLNGLPSQEQRVLEPATKKFETTIITEKRMLQFECEGVAFSELLSAREVASWTKRYRLKSNWESLGTLTNYPGFTTNAASTALVLTNLTITNTVSSSKP